MRTSREIDAGIARVEAHYASRWSGEQERHEVVSGSAALVLWPGRPVSRWPSWASDGQRTVASLYVPLGYERAIAGEPLAAAPLRLAALLGDCPSAIEHLCAPYVCGVLDAGRRTLRLHTDALGVGRLFEVRTERGWVWSNRPEAALAFAGLTASADEEGWAQIAVVDELFGHVTPYAGVRVVDAATTITWDERSGRLTTSAIDTMSWLAAPSPRAQSRELIEAAADELTTVARSVTHLYPERPVVDLTGGRDSRLVAAAFLAADAEVTLHTHDALPGDLEVARELVALLDDPPPHRIDHVATGGVAAPAPWQAMRHAAGWHAYAEGLRPYSYLHYRPPAQIDGPCPVAIGGAGGEVAHGYYYPPGRPDLDELPEGPRLAAYAESIVARHAPVAGAHPVARAAVRAHIEMTLRDIAARGYRDRTVLDVFYLRERIRRWGSTGERPGVISPLLATSFLRACLTLTPEQRTGNELHRELTRRLAPHWADVPYVPG